MKFSCVYVEEEVRDSDRVRAILTRIRDVPVVTIERFGEVFNRNSQNFRLQKANPAVSMADWCFRPPQVMASIIITASTFRIC